MIAILYPLKMDKNLSEAYSSIYESSASDGSSDGNYHDVGGGDFRSKDQIVRMNNDPKGTKKYGRRMMKGVGNVITDLKIPTVKKQDESLEPEMDVVEGQKYGMYKGDGKPKGAMKAYLDNKAKKLEADQKKQKKEYRNNPAFGDPSHHSNKKMQYNSRYRKEWEEIKLMEMNEYRDSFEEWLNGLVEEGYDIERWDDADLIETFINESDLWDSKDAVIQAITESDKKGKGSGTKDACYHKVKSRYSVWPSAYASGALVKCRKKGAKNWGNSSKKEDFSNWREDLGLLDENRAAAYTAGMSPEQKAVEMRKISPKVADDAGRAHDKFMFGSRKKGGKENRKYEKEIRKSIPSDKPNRNKTGRGMPVSYRDSYEKDRDGVIQSKIRQGKGSFKDLGKKK